MVSLDAEIAAPARFGRLPALAPGLALTAVLAGVAFALRLIPGVATLSPMILAVLLGVVLHNSVGARIRSVQIVTANSAAPIRMTIMSLCKPTLPGRETEAGPAPQSIPSSGGSSARLRISKPGAPGRRSRGWR
jgi:hypothetical protein